MKKLALIIVLILGVLLYVQLFGGNAQTQTQTVNQPFEVYSTVAATGQSLLATREHTPLPATMVPNLVSPQQATEVQQQQVQPSQMQSAINNVKTTRAIYMTCVAKASLNTMTNGFAACPLEKAMFENAKTVLEAVQHQATQ